MGYSPGIEAEFQHERNEYEQRRCILPRVLILMPTNELAEEQYHFAAALCENTKVTVGILPGGRYPIQQALMANNATDILIACPGTLQKSIGRHGVGLEIVEAIVFDEIVSLLGGEYIYHHIQATFFSEDPRRWHLQHHGQHVRRVVADALLKTEFAAQIDEIGLLRPNDDPENPSRKQIKLRAELADHRRYNLITVRADTEREFEQRSAEWVIANCPSKTLIFTPLKKNCATFSDALRRLAGQRGIYVTTNNSREECRLFVNQQSRGNPDTIVVASKVFAHGVNIPNLIGIVSYKAPVTIEELIARASEHNDWVGRSAPRRLVRPTACGYSKGAAR